MKIQHTKNEDYTGTVSVILEEGELDEKANQRLKELRKKITMPGFRPGKVPMSLVKKQYGEAARAEALEKILTDALSRFKDENKLNLIGQFLPVTNTDKDSSTYQFEYAQMPPFDIDWDKLKKENKIYQIEVSGEEVNDEIEYLQTKHGKTEKVEKFEPGTLFTGFIVAQDNKEWLSVINLKYEDTYKKTAAELEKLDKEGITLTLGEIKKKKIIDQETYEYLKDKGATDETVFELKKLDIQKIIPAELNEEFFKQVFPGKEIKTGEEFKQVLREEMEKHWNNTVKADTQNQILYRLYDYVQMDIPIDFLKRWIKETEETVDEEQLEKLANEYVKAYKFNAWFNHFLEENQPVVTQEDLITKASADLYNHILSNPEQYPTLPTLEEIQSYAEYYLQDEKYKSNIERRVLEDKFVDHIYQKLAEETKPEKVDIKKYREQTQPDAKITKKDKNSEKTQ